MTISYDGRFDYRGYHGSKAQCYLRVYTHPDRPAVVIATELPDNHGTSITNVAETLAAEVCERFEIDPVSLVWIEHYLAGKDRTFAESFDHVRFIPTGNPDHGLGQPTWRRMSKDWVEDLIGGPLGDVPTK